MDVKMTDGNTPAKMDAKSFDAWKAAKIKAGKWQGGDTPDAKYSTKVSPGAKPVSK